MKSKNSRYQVTPFSRHLVRPTKNDHPGSFQIRSASGLRGVRARKIFVIKLELQASQANAADRKMQHILMFDDHPDSLRILFGIQHVQFSAPLRVISWELILASIVTICGLIGMFWPIL